MICNNIHKAYHTKKSFQEEYTELIKKFGLKRLKDTTN